MAKVVKKASSSKLPPLRVGLIDHAGVVRRVVHISDPRQDFCRFYSDLMMRESAIPLPPVSGDPKNCSVVESVNGEFRTIASNVSEATAVSIAESFNDEVKRMKGVPRAYIVPNDLPTEGGDA